MHITESTEARNACGWEERYRNNPEGAAAWGSEPQPFVDMLVKLLAPDDTVADLGCGDGRNTIVLDQAGLITTAVDVSPTALELLMQRFRMGGRRPPTTVLSSLEGQLPLAANQFDAVLCADTLPQLQNPRHTLDEIWRILKPGGLALVNVFSENDCAFGVGDIVAPGKFMYLGTLFSFYRQGDLDLMVNGLLSVERCQHMRWDDPPHIGFRPHPHTHDAYVYWLRKPGKEIGS